MGQFDDLQEAAKSAHKAYVPQMVKGLFIFYMVGFPAVGLLFWAPVMGADGWGITGGIAGLFASMTIAFAAREAYLTMKGL